MPTTSPATGGPVTNSRVTRTPIDLGCPTSVDDALRAHRERFAHVGSREEAVTANAHGTGLIGVCEECFAIYDRRATGPRSPLCDECRADERNGRHRAQRARHGAWLKRAPCLGCMAAGTSKPGLVIAGGKRHYCNDACRKRLRRFTERGGTVTAPDANPSYRRVELHDGAGLLVASVHVHRAAVEWLLARQ